MHEGRLAAQSLALGLAAVLAACGGGGGGGSAPAPTAPVAPAFNGTRLTIATCATNCIGQVDVHVDSTGETTVFWTEGSGSAGSYKAANVLASANGPAGSGTIDSYSLPNPQSRIFAGRALGPRKFIVLDADVGGPFVPGSSGRARVVSFAGAAAPAVGAPVALSSLLLDTRGLPALVRDGNGATHAFENGAAGVSTLALDGSTSLSLVPSPQLPSFTSVLDANVSDFQASVSPRALWATRAQQSNLSGNHMFVSHVQLSDGAVLPPAQYSSQPVTEGTFGFCSNFGGPTVAVTSPTDVNLAWRQVGTGGLCELVVNGVRVSSADYGAPGRYALSGRNGELVIVWEEARTDFATNRLLWSRRDPVTAQWSAPAPVAPELAFADDFALVILAAAGPNGTLAVLWQRNAVIQPGVGQPREGLLLSKYVDGAWRTISASGGTTVHSLAINANGTAAAVFTVDGSLGATQELAAYRF